MSLVTDTDRARDALNAIPADIPRDLWVRVAMGAKAAGLNFGDFDTWSQNGQTYKATDCASTWRSIHTDGGVGAGTLFSTAKAYGWRPSLASNPANRAPRTRGIGKNSGNSKRSDVVALWNRCKPVSEHPYITAKDGMVDGLRVVPTGVPSPFARQDVTGWLVVPTYPNSKKGKDGNPQSLQFIPPPGTGKKRNMPGATMRGASFIVGALGTAEPVYLCEGIGQAWACNQATGRPAVVCFGWGNVARIAAMLADYPLVLVPDRGKEVDAETVACDTGASVAIMPEQAPDNYDANDYARRKGYKALASLLEQTVAPAYPAPEPLPAVLPNVEPFAPGLLPSSLVERCTDIAERMQCAPDFPAIGSMVALGSVIGRSVGIRPKQHDDWLVVPNLWGCIVGRPSVLKSPALKDALTPIGGLEAEAGEVYQQTKQAHDTAEIMADLEKKAAKKQAEVALRNGNKDEAESILTAAGNEPEPPIRRRFKTNDATVEKLGELLADNPRGVLMFRDELSGWLAGLDKDGRESERSFYLEAFNGNGSFDYDRIGRGHIHIGACTVSVLGGTQPGKLAQYVRQAIKGGVGDDGLIQRFQMVAWPDNGGWEEWHLVKLQLIE